MRRLLKTINQVQIFKEDDEYQVVSADGTYFCGDWPDALATARLMAGQDASAACEKASNFDFSGELVLG